MIRRFEGLARPPRRLVASQDVLVHLQIRLKLQCDSNIPMLLFRKRGQKLLTKYGGVLARQRGRSAVLLGAPSLTDDFESLGGNSKESFALQYRQEIAIERGVNL